MINFSLQGKNALAAKVKNLGPAVRVSARKKLGIIGEHLATDGRQHFEDSGLHVRSGDFRRSFAMMPVEENEHGLTGGMLAGQGLPYPPVHEFGATITAKNGGMLAIPMEDALTPSGVQRFAPRDAEAAGYTRVFFSRVGSQVMMYGVKDGVLHALFILVPQVTIPARPTVYPTLERNRSWIERQLQDAINEGMKEAGE